MLVIQQRLRELVLRDKPNLIIWFKKDDIKRSTFLGANHSQINTVIKEFISKISLKEIDELLKSDTHEDRMMAIKFLIKLYLKSSKDDLKKDQIFQVAKNNLYQYNQWDLIDTVSINIFGKFYNNKEDEYKIFFSFLDDSNNPFLNRIFLVSLLPRIRLGQIKETFKDIQRYFTYDNYLVKKALIWILKECYKHAKEDDKIIVKDFIIRHSKKCPSFLLKK